MRALKLSVFNHTPLYPPSSWARCLFHLRLKRTLWGSYYYHQTAQNEIELEELSGKPKVSQSISSWAKIQNNSDFKIHVLSTAPCYLWARTASTLGAYFPGTPKNNTGSAYLQMNSTSRFLSSVKSRVSTHSRPPSICSNSDSALWRVTLPSDGAVLQSSRNPTNSSIDENCCCTPALTFQSIIVLLWEEWPLGYLQFSRPNSSMTSLFKVKVRKIVNLPEAFQNILTLISSLVHSVHLLFWSGTQSYDWRRSPSAGQDDFDFLYLWVASSLLPSQTLVIVVPMWVDKWK